MALWLVRAGRHGEYEKKFLGENRIYLTWDVPRTNLNQDLLYSFGAFMTVCQEPPPLDSGFYFMG